MNLKEWFGKRKLWTTLVAIALIIVPIILFSAKIDSCLYGRNASYCNELEMLLISLSIVAFILFFIGFFLIAKTIKETLVIFSALFVISLVLGFVSGESGLIYEIVIFPLVILLSVARIIYLHLRRTGWQ